MSDPYAGAAEDVPPIVSLIGKGLSVDDCIDAHLRGPAERCRQIESEPLPATNYHVLAEAAAEAPDGIAWNFFDAGIKASYREVRDDVNRLASALHGIGIRKGDHVAVMIPNIPAFPTTWLALGRIGAVMVPVNVRYRAHDLDYVINDAHVRWMVVHRDCLTAVEAMAHRPVALTDTHMVVVDGQDATSPHHDYSALLAGGDPGFEPPQAVGAQDLMNIQYTSGTTGFPKGCMLRQCYWTATAKIAARRDGIRYHNILAAQPFYYMDPQWLMLMAFYHRGTVHVAAQPSATRFMGWVREHHIQFCIFPEVVYRQPPDARDADNALRRVNVYGLRPSVHADLERRFNVRARECFGMTEIGATLFTPLEAAHMVGSGSCGIAGPWREARVVDDDGHDVPRGEIGELVVRGPNIFLRYYEKPEANAGSFFGDWFRTGDLFRQDDDGWFFLVGRKKDMVRRSGENIAAREVEAVLVSIDGIADAAVLGVPDSMRGEEVKAYIVLDESVSADTLPPERIAELTGEQLAAFKVPRYFEYVAELPRTPSMKIAKGVLREAKADLRKDSFDRVNGVWL